MWTNKEFTQWQSCRVLYTKYLTVIDVSNHYWRRKNNFIVNHRLSLPLPSTLHFTSQMTNRCLLDGSVLAGESFLLVSLGLCCWLFCSAEEEVVLQRCFVTCPTGRKNRIFGSDGKESACNTGDLGSILSQEDPLEKGIVTHSSILAWKIPWTEEPGRPQSTSCKELGTTKRLTLSLAFKWQRSLRFT